MKNPKLLFLTRSTKTVVRTVVLLNLALLTSCSAYFNQPFIQEAARTGEKSASTNILENLPEAAVPLEVAVYSFSDQTGQFKPVENGSTFSTAVTQGSTTMLIKALEDSGWFRPIERENLSNLSTERNIIRNTKQEYIKNLDPNTPALPPLLYAGLILEGGIVSYDTNIVTGGIGVRYFGLGGAARYRQDRITVYLRAVSTTNGEILKTVYVSKTILSQALDASFFRFVKFQRLLEAETGITQSEPVQLAVKDAIEKAVHDLIVEGVIDKLWSTKAGKVANDELVDDYLETKNQEESLGLYNRLFVDDTYKNTVSLAAGTSHIDGDFATKRAGFYVAGTYQRELNQNFDASLGGSFFRFDNGSQFSSIYGAIDLNAIFYILPKDNLAPFIYAGPGLIFDIVRPAGESAQFGDSFLKIQYGVGLQYKINPRLGIKVFAEQNLANTDELDLEINGTRNDFYYNFGVGLNYNFNFNLKRPKGPEDAPLNSAENE